MPLEHDQTFGRIQTTPGAAGPPPRRVVVGMLAALAIGLALGALTDAGQTWLPWTSSSLANSGGSWVLISFLVALAAGTAALATVWGAGCLVALVVGYYVTADLRGIPLSASSIGFWIIAAAVIGPVVGLAAGWVRHDTPARAAIGAGALGGLVVGEAVYGLAYLTDSTSSGYWLGQLGVGSAIAAGLAWWRGRRWANVGLSVATGVAVGAVTVGAYTGT